MKRKKILFMAYSLACFAAACTCLIVDLAVNGRITWALYPLLSIAFGWAAFSPLFAKKHKTVLVLGSFTVLILPYLNLLSKITPVTDWFMPVGLPSAVAGSIGRKAAACPCGSFGRIRAVVIVQGRERREWDMPAPHESPLTGHVRQLVSVVHGPDRVFFLQRTNDVGMFRHK